MNSQDSNTPDERSHLPEALSQRLEKFRSRLRLFKLIEICLSALVGLFIAYFIVFLTERFVTIPTSVRALILLIGTVGFTIGIPLTLHKWFWNTRRLEQVAKTLRKVFPALGDEILSIIEMVDEQTGSGASPRLIAAATQQTSERVDAHDLDQAAPITPAKKRGFIVGGILSAVVLAAIVVPGAAGNSWLRFLNPWTETERFTFTQLDALPDTINVPYGEPFSVEAKLAEESEWRPASAVAKIGPSEVSSQIEKDTYSFSLPAQTGSESVKISAGDDDHSLSVIPVTRPELLTITSQIELPAYLEYSEPITRSSTNRRFAPLVGSTITFQLEANREIQNATFDQAALSAQGQTVSTPSISVSSESSQHVINWSDTHGLSPRKAVELHIKPTEDQAPSLVFEQIKDRILLESKSLRFNFSARDDFGISKIGLEWTDDSLVKGEKILLAGSPTQTRIREAGIFTPSLEGISPQMLTLRLFIEDRLPGRERIYSRPQTLHVMSHDEHVSWIDSKMKQWKSSADAIYEREVALADETRALRELSDEEKLQPENIQRLQEQVAAERENARRLSQAVSEGAELIESAMLNENIRAQQVETWANSLERLDSIAEDRLPELADQLDDVRRSLSQSQGQPSETQSSTSSQPGPTGAPQEPPVGEDRSQVAPRRTGPAGANAEAPPEGPSNPRSIEETMHDKKGNSSEEQTTDEEGDAEQESNGETPEQDVRSGIDLPSTQLINPDLEPAEQEEGDEGQQQPQAEEELEELGLDEIIEDHDALLEEFRQAREAMDQMMGEFENSTFVRRFKSAARLQLNVASKLNKELPSSFGSPLEKASNPQATLSELITLQAEIFTYLRDVKTDLEAYQTREAQLSRQAILDEMDALKMQVKLEELPRRIETNRLGDALHRVEFWADTFDRWGEELVIPMRPVEPGDNQQQQDQEEDDNPGLPASIVLEIMRLVESEMNLRDETRDFDRSRAAIDPREQKQRNDGLTIYQMSVIEDALDTLGDINAIPGADAYFTRPLGMLGAAVQSMHEASGMLFEGDAGTLTLAAESAAIEALLASGRTDPQAPDGAGDAPGEGPDGSESLGNGLAFLEKYQSDQTDTWENNERDPGVDHHAQNSQIPERFRSGLDSFTSRLNRLKREQQR